MYNNKLHNETFAVRSLPRPVFNEAALFLFLQSAIKAFRLPFLSVEKKKNMNLSNKVSTKLFFLFSRKITNAHQPFSGQSE